MAIRNIIQKAEREFPPVMGQATSGILTLPDTIVYTTGTQTISGEKTFSASLFVFSGANVVFVDNTGIVSGQWEFSNRPTVNGTEVLLSDEAVVYTTGDQTISGVKTFNDNIYIKNLFVTGTETIINTTNFNVQSPYLLLNLTGGAVDGGIFFVTGSGLTGINDSGPIIGFDHSNKFKFGVSTRGSDLTTLPDIASVQQINSLSGYVDSNFVTKSSGQNSFIINLFNTSDTQSIGHNYFGNIAATISTTASGVNRRFPVLENCEVRKASWTFFSQTVGNPIQNCTGYFINTTTNTTGIISTVINNSNSSTPTHYTATFSPPITISSGDFIVCSLFGPSYATTFPGAVRNSVNLYCYN